MAQILPSREEEERARIAAMQDAITRNNEKAVVDRVRDRRVSRWALGVSVVGTLIGAAGLVVALVALNKPPPSVVVPPQVSQVAPVQVAPAAPVPPSPAAGSPR